MKRFSKFLFLLMTVAVLPGCTSDNESATNLAEQGPPMVRQLFLIETYENSAGATVTREALGFGYHADVNPDVVHPVTTALPLSPEPIRVVVDELLVGNSLEEIGCFSTVDEDSYATVPEGTTPDDIALCTTPRDPNLPGNEDDLVLLRETCKGEHAVCVREDGTPVGVIDITPMPDGDGAADDLRFIDGAVGIRCGDIDVPMDLNNSFWQPSGNQFVPTSGGTKAIGPAVFLKPLNGLPTGSTCTVVFADSVTDKSGNRVCAPKLAGAPNDGSVWPPSVDCPDGDTSAVQFQTGGLAVLTTLPANEQMNVARTTTGQTYADIRLDFNAAVDVDSISNISISPALAFTVTAAEPQRMTLRIAGGYAASTTYTVTVPVTVTDFFGIAMPAVYTFTFTTRA